MAGYTLEHGMDVFSSDGQKLGTIQRLFSAAPTATTPATADDEADTGGTGQPDTSVGTGVPAVQSAVGLRSAAGSAGLDSGPATAIAAADGNDQSSGQSADQDGVDFTPSDTKYLEIHHGGVLGFGGTSFYVPYSQIETLAPDAVTLKCAAGEVESRFAQSPAVDIDQPEK